MNPDMLERVDAFLQDAGLYNGWISQLELWNDTGDGNDRFIVLQSNGGTALRKDLASDYYFDLLIVGRQGLQNLEETKGKALEIISYIKDNPLDSCLNYINLQQPLPKPALTEEKRPVYDLMLRVVWGE